MGGEGCGAGAGTLCRVARVSKGFFHFGGFPSAEDVAIVVDALRCKGEYRFGCTPPGKRISWSNCSDWRRSTSNNFGLGFRFGMITTQAHPFILWSRSKEVLSFTIQTGINFCTFFFGPALLRGGFPTCPFPCFGILPRIRLPLIIGVRSFRYGDCS